MKNREQAKSDMDEPELFYINPIWPKEELEDLHKYGFDVFKDEALEFYISEEEELYCFRCEGLSVYDLIKCFREDFDRLHVFVDADRLPSDWHELTMDMQTSKPINMVKKDLHRLKGDRGGVHLFSMYISSSQLTQEDTQTIRESEEKEQYHDYPLSKLMKDMNIKYYVFTHGNYSTSFCTFNREQMLRCIDYAVRGNLYNFLKKVLPELPLETKEQLFYEAKRNGIVSSPIGGDEKTSIGLWDDLKKQGDGFILKLHLGKTYEEKRWHSTEKMGKAYLTYDGTNWDFRL